jgi:hypothetical protein
MVYQTGLIMTFLCSTDPESYFDYFDKKKDMVELIPPEYNIIKPLVQEMLSDNPDNRPGFKDLYYNKLFDKYGPSEYPLPVFSMYINPDYIKIQPDINFNMREILIDWMTDVCTRFHCYYALVLAVNILDRFLAVYKIERKDLQKTGAACLYIASWLISREMYNAGTEDFKAMAGGAFTMAKLNTAVWTIIQTLNGDLFRWTFDTHIRRQITSAYKKDVQTVNPSDVAYPIIVEGKRKLYSQRIRKMYTIITLILMSSQNIGKSNDEMVALYLEIVKNPEKVKNIGIAMTKYAEKRYRIIEEDLQG